MFNETSKIISPLMHALLTPKFYRACVDVSIDPHTSYTAIQACYENLAYKGP